MTWKPIYTPTPLPKVLFTTWEWVLIITASPFVVALFVFLDWVFDTLARYGAN